MGKTLIEKLSVLFFHHCACDSTSYLQIQVVNQFQRPTATPSFYIVLRTTRTNTHITHLTWYFVDTLDSWTVNIRIK